MSKLIDKSVQNISYSKYSCLSLLLIEYLVQCINTSRCWMPNYADVADLIKVGTSFNQG